MASEKNQENVVGNEKYQGTGTVWGTIRGYILATIVSVPATVGLLAVKAVKIINEANPTNLTEMRQAVSKLRPGFLGYLVGSGIPIAGAVLGYYKAKKAKAQFEANQHKIVALGQEKTELESRAVVAEKEAAFVKAELKRRAAKEEGATQGAVVG